MRKRCGEEEKLYHFLEDKLRELDVELIDLRFEREGPRLFLRLYIDRPQAVSIEDCERVSLMVDPLLDDLGETRHDYLEVSSAGLDRVLETERDFRLHLGEALQIHLYQKMDGRKDWEGILAAADAEELEIHLSGGEAKRFKRAEIAAARRMIRF